MWISVPFPARSFSACVAVKLFGFRGNKLNPATVSTRNSLSVVKSLKLMRRKLVDGPLSCAATTSREHSFPVSYLGMCTRGHVFLRNHQRCYDTYRNLPRIAGRVLWGRGYCTCIDAGWTNHVTELCQLLANVPILVKIIFKLSCGGEDASLLRKKEHYAETPGL